MPEILDGHNIADFIDPDIDAKLAELEREVGGGGWGELGGAGGGGLHDLIWRLLASSAAGRAVS